MHAIVTDYEMPGKNAWFDFLFDLGLVEGVVVISGVDVPVAISSRFWMITPLR